MDGRPFACFADLRRWSGPVVSHGVGWAEVVFPSKGDWVGRCVDLAWNLGSFDVTNWMVCCLLDVDCSVAVRPDDSAASLAPYPFHAWRLHLQGSL